MAKFEFVNKFKSADLALPVRKTAGSAGYDLAAAEDTIIPSFYKLYTSMSDVKYNCELPRVLTLQDVAAIVKSIGAKPTLVSTGVKCKLDPGTYLELSVRSSTPLKHWLILANGIGVIDADYYNNPDNEGEIFLQLINLSPFDIVIQKGEYVGQGIIKNFLTTEDDIACGERLGGFGSTTL